MSFIKIKSKPLRKDINGYVKLNDILTCDIIANRTGFRKKEKIYFKQLESSSVKSINDLTNILFKHIIDCVFKMYVEDIGNNRYIFAVIIQVVLVATLKFIKKKIKNKYRKYLWNI